MSDLNERFFRWLERKERRKQKAFASDHEYAREILRQANCRLEFLQAALRVLTHPGNARGGPERMAAILRHLQATSPNWFAPRTESLSLDERRRVRNYQQQSRKQK